MNKAVVFGCGAVGRGFIGASLSAAGWHVTFVDVVESLVERLNLDGGYNQIVVLDDQETAHRIEPVSALLLSHEESVVEALTEANLVATAVGAQNLDAVAKLLGHGILARERGHQPPMDVLLCENLHGAAEVVRGMLTGHVGDTAAQHIGLCDTSIGRMIPVPLPNPDDPTCVRVEPYSFLPYDATGLKGAEPEIPDLIPIREGFDAYGDRKLYIHNMGHCMLAYLGQLRGHKFMWEAVGDLELRGLVSRAMSDAASALAITTKLEMGDLLRNVDDLLNRFGNRGTGDTTERVGRDAARKMQPGDRMLGAYELCRSASISSVYVSLAVALGANALLLAGWEDQRVAEHLDEHLFPGKTSSGERTLLFSQIEILKGGLDLPALVSLIDAYFVLNPGV